MKAKFIGKSSMGFVTGETYDIKSRIQMIQKQGSSFRRITACICIYDNNSIAWCPYQSLEAVMKNWKIL